MNEFAPTTSTRAQIPGNLLFKSELNFPEVITVFLNSLLAHGFKLTKLKVKREYAQIKLKTGIFKYEIKIVLDADGRYEVMTTPLPDEVPVEHQADQQAVAARMTAAHSQSVEVCVASAAIPDATLEAVRVPASSGETEGEAQSSNAAQGLETEATPEYLASAASSHLFSRVLAPPQTVAEIADGPSRQQVAQAVDTYVAFWNELKALLNTNNEALVATWLGQVDLNIYIQVVTDYVRKGTTGTITDPILRLMFECIATHFAGRASMDDVVKFSIMAHARIAHLQR